MIRLSHISSHVSSSTNLLSSASVKDFSTEIVSKVQKSVVQTMDAPQAIGPYVQGVKYNGLVYTSGQIGLNKEGQLLATTIQEQSEQVMMNLKAVLIGANSGMDRIIKVTCFLKDMNDFAEFNKIYASHLFAGDLPARSCVEVSRLPKDVLVEVECVAIVYE